MGKVKQRPRLSQGFATEQNKLKMISRNPERPSAHLVPPVSVLKKIQSGKIRKKKDIKHRVTEAPAAHQPTTTNPLSPDHLPVQISASRKDLKTEVRSKKGRLLMKKVLFQKKIELIQELKKSKEEARTRQKTVIVGDMKPILDALPDLPSTSDSQLQELVNQCYAEEMKKPRRTTKLKMKKREKEIADGLNYFDAALRK